MAAAPRRPVAVVILAAGQGTRTKLDRSKMTLEICGWSLVRHVAETSRALKPERIVVVVGHGREAVEKTLDGVPGVVFAVQKEQRGTADAVRAALPKLRGFDGTVMVLNGDVPLVRSETLRGMLRRHRRMKSSASVLSTVLDDAAHYGRILRDAKGGFVGIREAKDCTVEQLAIGEMNTGLYAFEMKPLRASLRKVGSDNQQGEFYLTDVPEILRAKGDRVAAIACGTPDEVLGVNTLAELAEAGQRLRFRILEDLMASGVIVADPATTFVDRGVKIGVGTRILPCTVIEKDVVIGAGCEVGPFSHVRPGTVMKDRAEVGNFVETKKTTIGEGTKAKHLTYLGDAEIGKDANIGCGTITANYDGRHKHRTVIDDRAHIGSGTVLVAPVRVGKDAVTGAGAIVTAGKDVADGDTVIGVPARSLGSLSKPASPASSGATKTARRRRSKQR